MQAVIRKRADVKIKIGVKIENVPLIKISVTALTATRNVEKAYWQRRSRMHSLCF